MEQEDAEMEEEGQSMLVPTVTGAPKRRRGRPPKAALSRIAGSTGPATGKAAEGTVSSSRKRKAASPESPPLCMPAKRRGGIMGSELGVSERNPENPEIECARCVERGVHCHVDPKGPCRRCKVHKLGCSLMPFNSATGKTDRHKYSERQLLEFRLQVRERAPKGKKQAAHKPEQASSSMPSTPLNLPLILRLPSTSSPADATATDTREDAPVWSSRRSTNHPYDADTPKRCAAKLAATTAPTSAVASTSRLPPSHDDSDSTSAVASTSRLPASHGDSDSKQSHLPPWLQQAGSRLQPSCGDQSQARDDGDSTAANYRKLIEKLDAFEKWQRDIERRLNLKKAQALLSQ